MATVVPISEATARFVNPPAASVQFQPERAEDFDLAAAEEDEMAELWAEDRGNQGA